MGMEDLDMLGGIEVRTVGDLQKAMEQWRQEAEAERQKGIDKEREWQRLQAAMKSGAANFKLLAVVAFKLGAGDWLLEQLNAVRAAPDENGLRTALVDLAILVLEKIKNMLGH